MSYVFDELHWFSSDYIKITLFRILQRFLRYEIYDIMVITMAISKATWGHVVTCCVFCAISIGIWSCTIEITGVVRVIVVISKCGATICNLALLLAILFVCRVKIFYPIPVICSISTKSVECLQLRHFIKLQKLNLENTWF